MRPDGPLLSPVTVAEVWFLCNIRDSELYTYTPTFKSDKDYERMLLYMSAVNVSLSFPIHSVRRPYESVPQLCGQ